MPIDFSQLTKILSETDLVGWLIAAAAFTCVSAISGVLKEGGPAKWKHFWETANGATRILAALTVLIGFAKQNQLDALGVGLLVYILGISLIGTLVGILIVRSVRKRWPLRDDQAQGVTSGQPN
jgi:hypothetical protein